MLDHRNVTTSSRQYSGDPGVWTREMDEFALALGARRPPGRAGARPCSPAAADDLSGLPTTYVDAGSAEVFRDEDVAYATPYILGGRRPGGTPCLGGGFHGFDALYPQARPAEARRTRNAWLARAPSPASVA